MSHHRVKLMQGSNDVPDGFNALSLSVSKLLDLFFVCGNKLMKRRIKEPDADRISFKRFIQLFKIALLIRKNFV